MVDAINKSKVIRTVGGVKTVEFPFDVEHLKKTKDFSQGLKAGESLEVEILKPAWPAKNTGVGIVRAATIRILYDGAHDCCDRVTSITGSAKKTLAGRQHNEDPRQGSRQPPKQSSSDHCRIHNRSATLEHR